MRGNRSELSMLLTDGAELVPPWRRLMTGLVEFPTGFSECCFRDSARFSTHFRTSSQAEKTD
jgi:hypothetical protein